MKLSPTNNACSILMKIMNLRQSKGVSLLPVWLRSNLKKGMIDTMVTSLIAMKPMPMMP